MESTFFSPNTSIASQPAPVTLTSSDSSNSGRFGSANTNTNSHSDLDRKMLAERATRPVFGGMSRLPMFPGTRISLHSQRYNTE